MLILSTYRVVLHPSYLQKVFSFIIFIKKDTDLRFSQKKAELLEACHVGGAKEWRALAPIANKTQTFDAVSLTICSSESWPGSFIAGTAPSFSIKRCANPASNWAVFIKRSSQNTWETPLLPRKTNYIHCSRNGGFFWEVEQGYIFLTTKNTLL